jgi:hypothetical protein
MLISTWQEALQLAWHLSVQVALGGVAVHWIEQRLVQSAVQSALHSLSVLLHWAMQPAWHEVSQEPVQSKVPGSTMQLAVQSASQVPVQLALASTLHSASQAATKLPGVHLASHWAEGGTNWHISSAARKQASGPA